MKFRLTRSWIFGKKDIQSYKFHFPLLFERFNIEESEDKKLLYITLNSLDDLTIIYDSIKEMFELNNDSPKIIIEWGKDVLYPTIEIYDYWRE